MCGHARGLRGQADGWATVGRQARAAGGERRPAAGRNRWLGRRRAGQNRDVTPGVWLTRMGGRVQAILPQSGMTACPYNGSWYDSV